jgi:hypothetical protein
MQHGHSQLDEQLIDCTSMCFLSVRNFPNRVFSSS